MAMMVDEKDDIHYEGNLTSRLMKYIMRYPKPMIFSLLLVLAVIGVELFRPTLIADAIDNHIEGYNIPYAVVEESEEATLFRDTYLIKGGSSYRYAQLVLYEDVYYYFDTLTSQESNVLYELSSNTFTPVKCDGNSIEIVENNMTFTGEALSVPELKQLRSSDLSGIVRIAIIYGVLMILGMVASVMQTWTLQKTGQQIIYEIRQELYDHVHALPLRFFDTHPAGRIVTRITNDVESLHDMYANILVRLFRSCVKIIGLAVVMLMLDWKLALYSFVMLPVILVLTYYFRTVSRKLYRVVRTKISTLNTFLSENISGMRLIQIFAREQKKYEEFEERSHDLYKAYVREIMNFATFRPLIYLVSQIALVIVLFKGSNYVILQTISIGTMYIFINYINSFFEPIQDLAEQFSTLQNAFASAEKIFTLLDEKNTIIESNQPYRTKDIQGKIEFKNVWFAYEGDDYVLRDVSFVIEPGKTVAFVGATGAGKSSILNLIGRYYDIQKGQILIDDVDIKEWSIEALRGFIGQVQQDVFIFTGDIKSNIRLLNEEITDDKISEAAKYVNAAYFIENLPNQYDESVSERGSTLSAGQRQLLSFARTLAFDPKILVMDEATANIDTETELLIQEALEKMMDGRTTIMVAHRLSTIQHADNIIVMHKGKVREMGTHQELLAQDGIYRKLYELQLYSV
ncbi:MAG: ABC transporter ATP-binding protein [Erysipelotrichaceae bacterium]|nr:ABC transporter ATP-binding protein [Erysipelotrichaceae bacterium]